jgi:hypoxanthine phosphoribosyltransferase
MAREIERRLAGANPVVLAVMHGGVFTAVELCRRFGFPYEFDYVHVTRYGGRVTGGKVVWHVRPRRSLAGRTVLVVDDVLDRGLTLRALNRELERTGVAAQYNAVLVRKRVGESLRRPHVDFAALEVDDVYVFGCGMDYSGYWRGLRGLYAVEAGPGRRRRSV